MARVVESTDKKYLQSAETMFLQQPKQRITIEPLINNMFNKMLLDYMSNNLFGNKESNVGADDTPNDTSCNIFFEL